MASSEDMSTTINRLGGGLINAILGALILWVGQTTFRHAGILASVDEKLNGVKHKFEDVEKRQEGLKNVADKRHLGHEGQQPGAVHGQGWRQAGRAGSAGRAIHGRPGAAIRGAAKRST